MDSVALHDGCSVGFGISPLKLDWRRSNLQDCKEDGKQAGQGNNDLGEHVEGRDGRVGVLCLNGRVILGRSNSGLYNIAYT